MKIFKNWHLKNYFTAGFCIISKIEGNNLKNGKISKKISEVFFMFFKIKKIKIVEFIGKCGDFLKNFVIFSKLLKHTQTFCST